MSRHDEQDKTLALAGMFQAATLVDGLARRGEADEADMIVCLESILATDPEDVVAVYGTIDRLRTGLEAIDRHFGSGVGRGQREFDVVRYVLSCIQVAHKLRQRPEIRAAIAEGIERACRQVERFSIVHDNVFANLADLYCHSISQIRPRIVVKGRSTYLTNPRYINRIRALLLAAVRSAVLWRQCGGRRIEFFYRRQAMVHQARRLLEARVVTDGH